MTAGDLDRLVTSPHWHPVRGMRGLDGSTIVLWERGAVAGVASKMDSIGLFREVPVYAGWLPDLSDPATVGCLLTLAREALGDRHAHLVPLISGGWRLMPTLSCGPSEGEALARAILAAPVPAAP